MADIFEDKTEMVPARSSLAVGSNHLRPDFASMTERMPGEPRNKEMSVDNCEPRKRGCHY